MEAKVKALGKVLEQALAGLGVPSGFAPFPIADLAEILSQPLVSLEKSYQHIRSTEEIPYNPVQQNVPAWAIFGMFFTAVPIAGSILQERKSGIWIRLTSLPVSHLSLFTGKILAYMGVCLCQFLLIGLIGTLLFPYIGLPAFTVSQNFFTVFLTVLASSLAACGYGIFLGMVCNTYEQASTLGSTAIVAAAAIGGVMVPVYAMPQIMQRLSIISPLNWSLTAFHDLLVRGYSFSAILNDLGRLTLFFLLAICCAWQLARRRM
jgi:ABC-2 type transport system permease protein